MDSSPFTTDLGGRLPHHFSRWKTCLLTVYDQIPLAIHVFLLFATEMGSYMMQQVCILTHQSIPLPESSHPRENFKISKLKIDWGWPSQLQTAAVFCVQESGWTTDQQGGYWFATISPGERDLDHVFLLKKMKFILFIHLSSHIYNMLPPSSKTMGHF